MDGWMDGCCVNFQRTVKRKKQQCSANVQTAGIEHSYQSGADMSSRTARSGTRLNSVQERT